MPLLGQGCGEPDPDLGASGLCPSPWDLLVSRWLGPDPEQQAGFLVSPQTCLVTTIPPHDLGFGFGW